MADYRQPITQRSELSLLVHNIHLFYSRPLSPDTFISYPFSPGSS